MAVVVVDYQAGNLYSVGRGLRHLGVDFVFSSHPGVLAAAERLILPGVGSAATAMNSLRDLGLIEVLRRFHKPFLGICLGMQLLFKQSEEESCRCLGLIGGSIRRFDSTVVKVPHVGWNHVRQVASHGRGLFEGVPDGSYFYFVHGYHADVIDGATTGVTDYSTPFSSVVSAGNFHGVQFHPELSGEVGLRLLGNFLCL